MIELLLETRIRRVDVPGSRIQDEMVFFDQQSGRYYATGAVGAEIWEFLENPKTIGEICEHLLSVFDIDRKTCEAEVRSFLTELHGAKIIVIQEDK